ncbi:unnamed protein product, partial [Closterium sp. NIES-54]
MTLRPSTATHRVPMPSPPASSLPAGPDPESDSLRAASPTVSHFLATAVTDPLFESTTASMDEQGANSNMFGFAPSRTSPSAVPVRFCSVTNMFGSVWSRT